MESDFTGNRQEGVLKTGSVSARLIAFVEEVLPITYMRDHV